MPPKKEQAKQKDAKPASKATAKGAEQKAASEEKLDAPIEQQGPPPKPRLKSLYREQVVPALTREFGYTNVMQVPRLEKIVLNMGVGQAGQTGGDSKLLDNAMRDMSIIAGQKPCVTRARKSISNFKIRAGARIGCKVTLRGDRMYEFLDRFVSTALPRVRDFQGISPNCFDGRGNFATGVREQLIFPEIEYDKIDKVRGMDIIICTSARTDEEARSLLKGLGMPFRER